MIVSWLRYSHSAPSSWPGKEVGRRPKALRACTHVGDLEEAPRSWLQPGSAPAIVIWGMNQKMEDFCFWCVILPLQ